MNFGTQVRLMRTARKMSQQELAVAARIDQRYISNIETELIQVNADWEARIRAALDWPVNADEAFAILASPAAVFEQAYVKEPEHA